MNTIRRIALAAGLCLACGSVAAAQSLLETKAFLNVNGGGQTQSRTFSTTLAPVSVYGQTATAATTASVDGGPIVDFSLGYRVIPYVPYFGVAFGYSKFSKSGSVAGAASVPSPIFFNQPASVSIPARGATHSERSIYVVLVGFVPLTNRIELALSFGPSFTRVEQEFITGFSVPAGTQNVTTVSDTQSGTAKGVNAGADLTYMVIRRVGVGGFIRYNGGSVDLPAASDVKVGGFQLGAGVRLRY